MLRLDQRLVRHEPQYDAGVIDPSSFHFAQDLIIPGADPTDPFDPLDPFTPSSEMPGKCEPRSFVFPL
jgi:hypothetical protein